MAVTIPCKVCEDAVSVVLITNLESGDVAGACADHAAIFMQAIGNEWERALAAQDAEPAGGQDAGAETDAAPDEASADGRGEVEPPADADNEHDTVPLPDSDTAVTTPS